MAEAAAADIPNNANDNDCNGNYVLDGGTFASFTMGIIGKTYEEIANKYVHFVRSSSSRNIHIIFYGYTSVRTKHKRPDSHATLPTSA